MSSKLKGKFYKSYYFIIYGPSTSRLSEDKCNKNEDDECADILEKISIGTKLYGSKFRVVFIVDKNKIAKSR